VKSIEDREIIDLFIAREEEAVDEIRKKYGGLCYSLAFNILHSAEDSEECVNDAYIKLWNNIPPAPDNLKAFICRVTKNSALTRLKYNSAGKRDDNLKISLSEIEDALSDKTAESRRESAEIGELISEFLRSQKQEVRNVFIRRYWFMDSVKEIAGKYSFSESKVKSMLFHTRNRLRKYLKKEGIDI